MFNWIGKQAFDGFLEKAKNALLGFNAGDLVSKFPFLGFAIKYWNGLSEEDQKKYADIIFRAAMKALEAYASK